MAVGSSNWVKRGKKSIRIPIAGEHSLLKLRRAVTAGMSS